MRWRFFRLSVVGEVFLTRGPISPEKGIYGQGDFHSGASVIFIGKVRNHSHKKEVLYLNYEAYETMAENQIQLIIDQAKMQWPVDSIWVRHRLGPVPLGEIAVFIEVQSAHRDEAYQASRYVIEQIKHRVPIWKKEYFADGTSEWSLCGDSSRTQALPGARAEKLVEPENENETFFSVSKYRELINEDYGC